MNYNFANNTLTIYLEGKVDTNNSAQIEEEINNIRTQNPDGDLVLDFEQLNYISSSGLRIILKLKRKEPSLVLQNVSVDVYDIFEMTGFTEMMEVRKAYKKLSVEGCEVIGQGANGLVYRYSPEIVVKVYKNPDSLDEIKNERELAKKAFVLGIPTAISYDIAKIGNCYGTVFELLNANSFAKLLAKNPEDIDIYVDRSVELLKKIHSTCPEKGAMPEIRKEGLKWAKFDMDYLPKETGEKLYRLVDNLKDEPNMIHGDFHLKNIMLQGDEVLLIDMDTLCTGNKLYEFAAIINAYKLFLELDHSEAQRFLGIDFDLAQKFLHKTFEKYFDNDQAMIESVMKKATLIGAMRLLRRTIKKIGLEDENGRKQAEYFKSVIIQLVDEIDDLNI